MAIQLYSYPYKWLYLATPLCVYLQITKNLLQDQTHFTAFVIDTKKNLYQQTHHWKKKQMNQTRIKNHLLVQLSKQLQLQLQLASYPQPSYSQLIAIQLCSKLYIVLQKCNFYVSPVQLDSLVAVAICNATLNTQLPLVAISYHRIQHCCGPLKYTYCILIRSSQLQLVEHNVLNYWPLLQQSSSTNTAPSLQLASYILSLTLMHLSSKTHIHEQQRQQVIKLL